MCVRCDDRHCYFYVVSLILVHLKKCILKFDYGSYDFWIKPNIATEIAWILLWVHSKSGEKTAIVPEM